MYRRIAHNQDVVLCAVVELSGRFHLAVHSVGSQWYGHTWFEKRIILALEKHESKPST